MFVDFHDRCFVSTSVTVIWGWENSDNVSLLRPVVTVHYELMSSGNQLQVVCMIELFWNVLSKSISSSSRRDTPTASIIRIWPEEITHWSFMRNLLNSVKLFDLFKSVNAWRQTSMKTENLVFNDCGNWESVKEISEIFPHICISILS